MPTDGLSRTSRRLSLWIPIGPYTTKRPTLQEILENTAPAPWTLSAFRAYLSRNHCLKTLEFWMDADIHAKYYRDMVLQTSLRPENNNFGHVRILWQKLLDDYIDVNSPRELNLPADVRDHLLSLPCLDSTPDPVALEHALRIIYELMEESVLEPFLNAIASYCGPDTPTTPGRSIKWMEETSSAEESLVNAELNE
ncbi:regulator of G protein signaling superfamily [Stipitochalara longipes BDJ]|nr:regulator of G protein signaling superfamily [Stipitochalara longipes BDJ]